jgi:hemerythrin-like domain-containing protein
MGAPGLRLRAQEFRDFFEQQLTRHFRVEEEVLFPFMRAAVPQSAPLLDDLVRDHEAFRQAAQKLAAATAPSKLIFDVGDLLERHIRKEERELFPLFESCIGDDQAQALGDEIRRMLA